MKKVANLKNIRVAPGVWGESKKRANIMLTPTALEKVDTVAEQMGLTRSEVLERLIRTHWLDSELLMDVGA